MNSGKINIEDQERSTYEDIEEDYENYFDTLEKSFEKKIN